MKDRKDQSAPDQQSAPEPPAPRLAVALQYEAGKDMAPRVTAKGEGELAERIIELAREHDIVVEGNPVLAQALAEVELDTVIPENLYAAVATVISFVMQEAEKKRKSPFYSPPEPKKLTK